jgi:hypothetical protein
MNKKHILAPLIALLFLVPLAGASSINRTLPLTVNPGETVKVRLDIAITAGETYYLLDETVPQGWIVTDPGSGDSSDPGHVKWAIIQNAASTTYTYEVRAPTEPGTYAFSGKYMFEGMKQEVTVGGQQAITVSAPVPTGFPGAEFMVVPAILIGALAISVVLVKSKH